MLSNFFNKIIPTLLIASILSFPIFPEKAHAQVSGGNSTMNGVSGVLAGCALSYVNLSSIGNAISNLFGGSSSSSSSSGGGNNNVPVNDAENIEETEAVKEENKKANRKEACLDAIARFAVLKLMDQMTLAIVDWINSGFNGNPFYPEDKPNFFENLAKDEVTTFTGWFASDPEGYPFGKIISETILLSVQRTTQENMRFSLNQVLQHQNQYLTYGGFQANFSLGGWAGYTALSLPNNNIFGNYLRANDHLSRQTAGTNVTIAANLQSQLNEGLGVLNQQECVESGAPPNDYIPPSGPGSDLHLGGWAVLPAGATMTQSLFESLPDEVRIYLDSLGSSDEQAYEYNIIVLRSVCKKWITTTPGRFIAEQTTQALGSPLRNLELGDELNENLGLIVDALLNKLVETGLSSLNGDDGYSADPNAPNYNPLWAQANDPDFGVNSGQPPVNEAILGNGVDLGVVQLQQNYIIEANESVAKLAELIRDIRALDYCVPGPNPLWSQDGYNNLQNQLSQIPQAPLPDPQNQTPAEYQASVQQHFKNVVLNLTGINISPTPLIDSVAEVGDFLTYVLVQFRNTVDSIYLPSNPPPAVKPTAYNYYVSQLSEYQAQLAGLQTQITNLQGIMPSLLDIQNQILALPSATQEDSSSPEMTAIASLFNTSSIQNALINQQQYNLLQTNMITYDSQIAYVNEKIVECIAETTGAGYPSNINERVQYPFDLSGNSGVSNIAPNSTFFTSQLQFSSGNGQNDVNVSNFNDGVINLQPASTSVFQDTLGSMF